MGIVLEKMCKGKIITLDGTDGCGKSTQFQLLKERLVDEQENVIFQKFPNYDDASCFLVKEYLSGKMGERTADIPAKVSSAFFGYDRAITFYKNKYIEKVYEGTNLILDRYTSANIIHQASHESTETEMRSTAKWIEEFEYNGLMLPRPDQTIFLWIDSETALANRLKRKNNDGIENDILERDLEYQEMVIKNSIQLAQEYGWDIVVVGEHGKMRTIADIHEEIYGKVKKLILK